MFSAALKEFIHHILDIVIGISISLFLSAIVYALFKTVYGPNPPEEVDWVMESIVTAIVIYGLNYMFFNRRNRKQRKEDQQRQQNLEADLKAIKQKLGITE